MTTLSSPRVPGAAALARTLLFVRGNRPDRFAKAAAAARDAVARWLSADGPSAVRVNGTKSVHYQQDVTALAGLTGLQAVVVAMADGTRRC